jgi:hypothetical protein
MINIKDKLKVVGVIIFAIIILSLGVMGVINIFGGVGVSTQKLTKNLDGLNGGKFEIGRVKMKFGIQSSINTNNVFALKEKSFELKANEISLKKSIFSNNISGLEVKNSTIVLYIQEDGTFKDALFQLKKIFTGEDTKEKHIKNIFLENVTLIITKLQSNTKTIINNFTGNVENEDDEIVVKGDFDLGLNSYKIKGFLRNENRDLELKLESENLIFKTIMENNSGKTSFSINNITKFLNEITPDTINFNLGSFDGMKNSLYFESEIKYNDVRKNLEFSNSKLQLFGGKEENVLIENLSNDKYKITLDIDELNIVKGEQKENDFLINDSKTPMLQFSNFFPQIFINLEAKVKTINLQDLKETKTINDLNTSFNLGYGKIEALMSFQIEDRIHLKSEAMVQNYETANRKGVLNIQLEGKKIDLTNFKIMKFGEYKGEKEQDFKLDLSFIIAGDKGIVEIISLNSNEIKLENSRLEFDLYLKDRDYILDLNFDTLDTSKIKLNLPSGLTQANSDLFKTLFNYLKFKDFSYINLYCNNCLIGEESYTTAIKTNITRGKIELEEFYLINSKIELGVTAILDIRNPQNNTANLAIEVLKWEDFKFENFINIDKIFTNFQDFKFPSLEDFNGSLSIYAQGIKNEFNNLNFVDLKWRLSSGFLKQTSSRMTLNQISQEDSFILDANLKYAEPSINLKMVLPLVELRGILTLLLNKTKFDDIKGGVAIAVGLQTRGFLLKDLINNANVSFEAKGSNIEVRKFGIDEIAKTLTNANLSFKKITNSEIQQKINEKGVFGLSGKINFANNEFYIESLELKSPLSSSLFVGKLILQPEKKFALQLLGKTATIGADLNKKLNGVMPVYLTCAIANNGDEFETKFDFTQVNKYSEARRVLFK